MNDAPLSVVRAYPIHAQNDDYTKRMISTSPGWVHGDEGCCHQYRKILHSFSERRTCCCRRISNKYGPSWFHVGHGNKYVQALRIKPSRASTQHHRNGGVQWHFLILTGTWCFSYEYTT
ncbi:hypothetical protein AVEN_136460-1 [Araneus ventricosus]|uniref:Uncharacterized protein n=1 Tax=Araneus ventricosus TaxID=182803 RepID=A0A4Y2JQI0_ARAVE|nr:hypothetical protein AVEN_136460-1 [Araneus ventricosus]